jgi:hypothetical protein
MIHNLQTNGSGPSIADERAAAFRAAGLPLGRPVAAPALPRLRRWAPWLAAGALCAGILGTAYALTPAVPSVAVRQVFVDVDGNGTLDLLLYGEVVLNTGPLAQAVP